MERHLSDDEIRSLRVYISQQAAASEEAEWVRPGYAALALIIIGMILFWIFALWRVEMAYHRFNLFEARYTEGAVLSQFWVNPLDANQYLQYDQCQKTYPRTIANYVAVGLWLDPVDVERECRRIVMPVDVTAGDMAMMRKIIYQAHQMDGGLEISGVQLLPVRSVPLGSRKITGGPL